MVTRKPVPGDSATINTTSQHSAPYPTTPIEPAIASSIDSNDFSAEGARATSPTKKLNRRDSEGSIATNGTWDDSDDEEGDDDGFVEVPRPLKIRPNSQDMNGLPAALRPGGGNQHAEAELPAALRPGPVGGGVVEGGNPWALESNNPFKPKGVELNHAGVSTESSQSAWQQAAATAPPSQPAQAPPPPPVELPIVRTPTEELSNMSLAEQTHDTASPTGSYMTAEVLPVPQKGMPPFSPVIPVAPTHTGQSSNSQAFPSTNPWSGIEGQSAPSPGLPPKDPLPPSHAMPMIQPPNQPPYPSDDQQASLDRPQQDQNPPPAPPSQAPPPVQAPHQFQPPPGPPPTSISHEEAQQTTTSTAVAALPPTDTTRNELYQVKHIRWYDASSESMRNSPILTQNANGPCPLLALVNAIVLSTPANINTPLVEALSDNGNRSQISLGFLLDALFDELTSGRRGEGAERLPDMTQLYAFLLALHTGMNVNPRFVSSNLAGTFEDTREMKLYSTLNIPLLHGWTPPPSSPAHMAFSRSAQTFEEAQNIQFLEADLLALPQLDTQQQQLLDDIRTIQSFLSAWPTQLTEHGLESLSSSIQPGQVVILFRNDHFSTLYKEPKNGALMTLVTDTGYSSHEEIVWESLVDVNGAASEMFSGDFRVVSHGEQTGGSRRNHEGDDMEQWEDARRRSRLEQGVVTAGQGNLEIAPPLPGPRPTTGTTEFMVSASEQEDHDLALALQLQEEEEDAHRQAEERRRREQELSERFLSSQETPPAIPPRRGSGRRTSGAAATQGGRQAVSRPAGGAAADAPPPTYEQSRTDRIVRPGERPPQPPGLSTSPQMGQQANGGQWGGFGTSAQAASGRGRGRGGHMRGGVSSGRGGGNVGSAANVKDAEEKCVLM